MLEPYRPSLVKTNLLFIFPRDQVTSFILSPLNLRVLLALAIPTVLVRGHDYSNRLDSEEFVQFTHKNQYIRRDTTTGPLHTVDGGSNNQT